MEGKVSEQRWRAKKLVGGGPKLVGGVRGHPSKLLPITKSDDPTPVPTPAFYIPPHRRQIQEGSP